LNKTQFEHTIRAVGSILADNQVLVIGSQAIHASIDYKLEVAERSIEVDVSSLNDLDGSKADLIDGSIGELSIFQETYGYYAQGVTPQTATLPDGWRNRLIPYLAAGTNGVTALCLEPHDLWISKAVAGRPKDREFCRALVERKLVEVKVLCQRLEVTASLNPTVRKQVSGFIENCK